MALGKSINKEVYGEVLKFKNAYIQIVSVSGCKEEITLQVYFYSNNTKQHLIETKIYSFIPSVEENAKNFIEQGYEYLKTLEEFNGSADLLD